MLGSTWKLIAFSPKSTTFTKLFHHLYWRHTEGSSPVEQQTCQLLLWAWTPPSRWSIAGYRETPRGSRSDPQMDHLRREREYRLGRQTSSEQEIQARLNELPMIVRQERYRRRMERQSSSEQEGSGRQRVQKHDSSDAESGKEPSDKKPSGWVFVYVYVCLLGYILGTKPPFWDALKVKIVCKLGKGNFNLKTKTFAFRGTFSVWVSVKDRHEESKTWNQPIVSMNLNKQNWCVVIVN